MFSCVFSRIQEFVSNIILENFICKSIIWQNGTPLLKNTPLNDFIERPQNHPVLKDLFTSCGVTDIKSEFIKYKKRDNDYINLLNKIATGITKKFRDTWKDFANTSIELHHCGNDIVFRVSEDNRFALHERSDGFQKLFSILLGLSAKLDANGMNEKNIILIDEPDQSLHPSAARHLRDELLRISENTLVIYATHSQYMLDNNCIDRHLIIKKNNEKTLIQKGKTCSPYSANELLLQAIGTSIFECIRRDNIIFEGWMDHQLFIKYIELYSLPKLDENIGTTYSNGITSVHILISIIKMVGKSFVIVADSDDASKNEYEKFGEAFPDDKGHWLTYT